MEIFLSKHTQIAYSGLSGHSFRVEEWTRSVRIVKKAKMTFRFDGQGREIVPDRWGKTERIVEDMAEDIAEIEDHLKCDAALSEDRAPISESPQQAVSSPSYRTVESIEEWADPFTHSMGTSGTVIRNTSSNSSANISSYAPSGYRQDELKESGESNQYYESDESYESYESDEPNESYDSWETHNYQPIRTKTSWWKVTGSLAGAVLTGALFGFVVLSMFNQDMEFPFPRTGSSNRAADQGGVMSVMGGVEEATLVGSVPAVDITLPAQSYHFLQYGVFSNPQGVELAQEELQSAGIAAARDTIDEKRVYAGVSTDREQAKLLSGQLKTAGVHLIIHEISLPAMASVEYAGDTVSLEKYFAESAELVHILSQTSALLLSQNTPQAQSVQETAEIEQKHQLWTESASAVRGKMSVEHENYMKEMEKAMNSAVMAMSEYNKNAAKTFLWEVQNEIMRFILAEQRLIGQGAS